VPKPTHALCFHGSCTPGCWFQTRIALSTKLPSHGPSLLKSGWNRSLKDSREWFGLLQPSHVLLVAALVPTVVVDESSRDLEVFVLLEVDEEPLATCPPMRLLSAVSRSRMCMMLATISHSLPSVGFA
jgi:hypothetical protein